MLTLRQEDFRAFFDAPFASYGEDSLFVSPMRGDLKRSLDTAANPLFRDHASRTWFTAHRNGRVLGRLLVHIHDTANRLHGTKRGYFGCFDCVDDSKAARALLGAGAAWLRDRGCDEMAGNFDLTITQIIGTVTEGFEKAPYTYQDWNPAHIPRLLAENGFTSFFPMRTFEADVAEVGPDSLLGIRQRSLLADQAWTWQPIKRRNLNAKLIEACDVLNDGFRNNAMFVPLTREEFLFPCEGMTWIMDETLSYTAYHRDEPVGVLLCIPDLNPFLRATRSRLSVSTPWHLLRFRYRPDRAAIVFFSIKSAYQGQGINGVLLYHLVKAMRQRGYRKLGISWISDSNKGSLRQMEKLGAKQLHRLHLFRKALA